MRGSVPRSGRGGVLWWGCWWIAAYHEVWTPLNPGIINSSYLVVRAGCQQRAEGGDWGCLPWKGFQLCCLYRIYFAPLSAQSKWHDRREKNQKNSPDLEQTEIIFVSILDVTFFRSLFYTLYSLRGKWYKNDGESMLSGAARSGPLAHLTRGCCLGSQWKKVFRQGGETCDMFVFQQWGIWSCLFHLWHSWLTAGQRKR